MDGKSRKFDPAKGVVNTPLCVTGPRAPLRSNLDDPEEWELSCSVDESVCRDEAHRTELVACCPIIKCGTAGCTGSCPLSVVEYGYTAGKKPARCEIYGKNSRVLTSRSQTPRLSKVKGLRETAVEIPLPPCLGNQAWSLGVIHRASNWKRMFCSVNSRHLLAML